MSQLIKRSGLIEIIKLLLFIFLIGISTIFPRQVEAVKAADWNAGYIIDDSIFYDNKTMRASDIQSFLESKVPTCDTGGTRPASDMGRSDLTHAQYAKLRGWPDPPYVCLRDYYENISTKQNNLEGRPIPDGAIRASQIIKMVADHYRINPRVFIVLLEKEQSLVTDTWPTSSQYRTATGYGCPDTAACDSRYYGFYNQVDKAGWQFRKYTDDSQNFRYKPNQVNSIQYNPNTACGGTNVYIESFGTSALYNYTPYQPNQAALNNLYGSGDGCSAYGNRNFWRIFNDWFGRTTYDCRSNEQPNAGVFRLYNRSNYKHFYTGYVCEAETLSRKSGYAKEGILHYQTSASSPYAVVVHRLYNPTTYQHLWATTQSDINNATQNAGYRYEGVAYYGAPPPR